MLERVKQRKSDEGFTLIELLIVIIILAILAAIVIFAVGTTTKNAAVSACQTTVKSTETAVEAFKAQTGTYPTSLTTLIATTKKDAAGTPVGPWLHTLPYHTTPLATGHKYAIVASATLATTGKLTVITAAGTNTADTATACTGA
jgi:general secretion pathway protein G